MSTTTATLGLKDKTLEQLRELRQLNVDSAKGFEECAELVKEHGLKQAFSEIAHTRREQAQTLATQIEWNDEAEEEQGSYTAAMHRAWIKVREAFSSDDSYTALAEAERGEDSIKQAYEEALPELKGSPIHDIVAEQYATVKKTHDRVRALRDAKKEEDCSSGNSCS